MKTVVSFLFGLYVSPIFCGCFGGTGKSGDSSLPQDDSFSEETVFQDGESSEQRQDWIDTEDLLPCIGGTGCPEGQFCIDTHCCPDGDLDGSADKLCGGSDCDDSNPAINPNADEVCEDGIDNNCDGQTDEGC